MKVKTIKKFFDIKNQVIREVGEEFEASKERVDDILSKDAYVEVIKEVKLEDLKVDELKELLDNKGIDYSSKDRKADLIKKLK